MREVGVIAVASHHPAWAAAAETHYLRQMRFFRVRVSAVKNAASKEKEAAAVLARLPAAGRCVLLESTGKLLDGDGFAAALRGWLDGGRALCFVVGGANGAGKTLRARADDVLSLSPLVFPHALARLMLVEQLFRADCQMRRHPYPR